MINSNTCYCHDWRLFGPWLPARPGDYLCEVPALVRSDWTLPIRLLYWDGKVWSGPGGEYEVRRYTLAPEPPPWPQVKPKNGDP
jgi:hypothetical protein